MTRENTSSKMEKDFMEQEMRLNSNTCQERSLVKVRYDLTSETKFRPYTDRDENFVFLPVQHTLTFEPDQLCLIDLGVQLIIPDNLYGVIRQTAPDTLALYTHSGVHLENTTVSFKVYVKTLVARKLKFSQENL